MKRKQTLSSIIWGWGVGVGVGGGGGGGGGGGVVKISYAILTPGSSWDSFCKSVKIKAL